jgi:peptidyl-tRNA hydrolase
VAQHFEKLATNGSINVMGRAMLAFCSFYQAKIKDYTAITDEITQSTEAHPFRLLASGLLEQLRGEY